MVLLWLRKNIISTFVEIIFWLPFTDTFLTNVPNYGSSKMTRMRTLLSDVKEDNISASDETTEIFTSINQQIR